MNLQWSIVANSDIVLMVFTLLCMIKLSILFDRHVVRHTYIDIDMDIFTFKYLHSERINGTVC